MSCEYRNSEGLASDADQSEEQIETNVATFYDQIGWHIGEDQRLCDKTLWEDGRRVADWYESRCRDRVASYVEASGRQLLDIGSGPAQHSEYSELLQQASQSSCIDISKTALAELKANSPTLWVIRASIRALPFDNEVFDLVTCFNVLNHVAKNTQARSVRETLRVLRPNGRAFFLYFNPKRLAGPFLSRSQKHKSQNRLRLSLYHHAFEQKWWRQFDAIAEVKIRPARFLFVLEIKRFIPDGLIGRTILRLIYAIEEYFPHFCCRHGAYYVAELTRR